VAHTFLWYDLETFGTDPRWDRIAQFAAIRTDTDFRRIGEPIVLHGRISPDYLPEPEACLVTGLTPRKTADQGLTEVELARAIFTEMAQPQTCTVGFNSLRFDDEFIRNLFYRNFMDPYYREYQHENTRWDILPLVQMTHDLRPEGINWEYKESGNPVFRLESLTAQNGIHHANAHDALADVEATIAVARLVRDAQPRLYDYHQTLRFKKVIRRMVNLEHPLPFLLTAPLFSRPGGYTTIVIPLSVHPEKSNEIIVFDLRHDPAPLWELSLEELYHRTFTRQSDLGDIPRIPLTGIQLNRVPNIAPLETLTPEAAARLNLDRTSALARAKELVQHPELATRIRQLYQRQDQWRQYSDPDLGIYSGGFFGDPDKFVFTTIHTSSPEELIHSPPSFVDPRGPEMLRRYVGRNFPQALRGEAAQQWRRFCARRLLAPEYDGARTFNDFRRRIAVLQSRPERTPQDIQVLKDLLDYAQWLEKHIMEGS
jgi:exodeoxyribonuclease-1